AITFLTLLLLWYILPDLFRRTWLWYRSQGAYRIELAGMLRLPGHGPAVIVTDAGNAEALSHVERAADRVLHAVAGTKAAEEARRVLAEGEVVVLALSATSAAKDLATEVLKGDTIAPVLPVHHAD